MDNWQRLEKVVRFTGLSINSFALHIGLKRSENLYQIKKGKHGISKALAKTITDSYPQISLSWLLTGQGNMLKSEEEEQLERYGKGIPFFNVDINTVTGDVKKSTKPFYYINVPVFNDCDFAALSTSGAMTPDIPAGAMVVLKKHEPSKILLGESYLVVTDNFCGIRNIRRHPSDEHLLRLVPRNLEDYDEMTIRNSEVRSLFLVRGVIINKTL